MNFMKYSPSKFSKNYLFFKLRNKKGHAIRYWLYYGPIFQIALPDRAALIAKFKLLFLYLLTSIFQVIAARQNIQANKASLVLIFSAISFITNLFLLTNIARLFLYKKNIHQEDYDSMNYAFRFGAILLSLSQLLFLINAIRCQIAVKVFNLQVILCFVSTLSSVCASFLINPVFCKIPFFEIEAMDLAQLGLSRYSTDQSDYQLFIRENQKRLDSAPHRTESSFLGNEGQ